MRGAASLALARPLSRKRIEQQRLLLGAACAHKVIGAPKVFAVALLLVLGLVGCHGRQRVLQRRRRNGRDLSSVYVCECMM